LRFARELRHLTANDIRKSIAAGGNRGYHLGEVVPQHLELL